MSSVVIDLTKCFECNNSIVELHHVVPKSLGGKKTVPLCESCHRESSWIR